MTVQCTDAAGEPLAAAPLEAVTVTAASTAAMDLVAPDVDIDVDSQGGGAVRVRYRPRRVGRLFLGVEVAGAHVAGSPFMITVVPGKVDAGASVVAGEGTRGAVAGSAAAFAIQARDAESNPVHVGGAPFRAALRWLDAPGPTAPLARDVRLVDCEDGTYLGQYVAPHPGRWHLDVWLGAQAVAGAPFAVAVDQAAAEVLVESLFSSAVLESKSLLGVVGTGRPATGSGSTDLEVDDWQRPSVLSDSVSAGL